MKVKTTNHKSFRKLDLETTNIKTHPPIPPSQNIRTHTFFCRCILPVTLSILLPLIPASLALAIPRTLSFTDNLSCFGTYDPIGTLIAELCVYGPAGLAIIYCSWVYYRVFRVLKMMEQEEDGWLQPTQGRLQEKIRVLFG